MAGDQERVGPLFRLLRHLPMFDEAVPADVEIGALGLVVTL